MDSLLRAPQFQHRCGKCSRPVIISGGEIVRACGHDDAGVTADISAVAYGKSHCINDGDE